MSSKPCPCGHPRDLADETFCWGCRGAPAPGSRETISAEAHDRRIGSLRNASQTPRPLTSGQRLRAPALTEE